MRVRIPAISIVFAASICVARAAPLPSFHDPDPRRYEFSARASVIDPRARPHPEIDFVFEKDGKPQDLEHASVDTRVTPQGKLVIWLMGYSAPLFERLNGYGLHAIRVHYANGWFNRFGPESERRAGKEVSVFSVQVSADTTEGRVPAATETRTLNTEHSQSSADRQFLGRIRLEAATGEDVSEAVDIPKPDGMMERALQFVKWLARENPPGRWDQFLADGGAALRWDLVIVAGSSHGSTTAARFAKHQRVDRVVMFCGPRDQFETWQGLPSATPANRFFGFSHVLDGGWTGHHYDRSWELLSLHRFGPVVNVDTSAPPFGNTRRLITAADVKGDARRAHSSVVPGGSAVKDAEGRYIHEEVWRYLFTHPVDAVGQAAPGDPRLKSGKPDVSGDSK